MMEELRKQILLYLEKNSRVNLGELAVLLGTDEVTVANEISLFHAIATTFVESHKVPSTSNTNNFITSIF